MSRVLRAKTVTDENYITSPRSRPLSLKITASPVPTAKYPVYTRYFIFDTADPIPARSNRRFTLVRHSVTINQR
jgi:phage-related baseplate assembly protein